MSPISSILVLSPSLLINVAPNHHANQLAVRYTINRLNTNQVPVS